MGFHIVSAGALEGWGSQFLYKAYKQEIQGGPIAAQFAASRTVFFQSLPMSTAIALL